MKSRNIVIGQRISGEKVEQAQRFRRTPTAAERALWERVRANRLAGLHFRRQQVIAGFIVDLYCHAAGLVVDVDGPVHQSSHERDEERDRILRQRA